MLLAESYADRSNFLADIPWPSAHPVYLRLVNTDAEAKNYASGGFHVAAIRGSCGGCADAASGFAKGGTDSNATCSKPLNDDASAEAWDAAAGAYADAYDTAMESGWAAAVEQLREANSLADAAYQAESAASGTYIAPPRDPGASASGSVASGIDPVGAPRHNWVKLGLAGAGLAALAGILGYTYIGGYYADKKVSTASMMMGYLGRRYRRRPRRHR